MGYKLLSLICILINVAACIADDEKLQIKVTQHLPCPRKNKKDPWSIVFPSMKNGPVVQDTTFGNCYRMTGPVQVNKPITGKLYAYLEVKNGTAAQPSPCRKAQSDGCRGIGSCVYCDLCSNFKTMSGNEVRVELKKGGHFNCSKGLDNGEYDETSFIFCMPTLEEFLKTLNIDRASWDQFAGNGQGAQTAFMTYYLFEDTPINKLSSEQLKRKVQNMDGVIGCHKLVMDVFSVKAK